MIAANELRIGNWVMYDNRLFQIEAISRSLPCLNTDEFGIGVVDWNNINPIPLTPEILEKCGLKNVENPKQYGWYISVGNRELCWCHADYISLEFKVGQLDDFCDTIKDIDCKHLHQLQNLYFALTGEELIYKNEN